MWDADSLILLLGVSTKCVAVAECFCPFFFSVCCGCCSEAEWLTGLPFIMNSCYYGLYYWELTERKKVQEKKESWKVRVV